MPVTRTIALAALLLPGMAFAHGPTRQKSVESVEVAAPAAAVWALVKDWGGMAKWHPAVESVTVNGTERILNLKGGGKVIEELEAIDDANMSLRYRMKDPGPLPVNNYSAQMGVASVGSGAMVNWKGAFYRAYLNNDPPPEQSDEAAVKAITGIYKSGLENLKKVAEGK
ncbi:MAG: SRPBCC family protein [Rhodocyclaceae bacterium]|nr:SRPBCC family protein [Rhodocyclaceae bacterium]